MPREQGPMTIFRKKAAEALVCRSGRECFGRPLPKIHLSVHSMEILSYESGLHMQVDAWKQIRVHTVLFFFFSTLAGFAVLATTDKSLFTQVGRLHFNQQPHVISFFFPPREANVLTIWLVVKVHYVSYYLFISKLLESIEWHDLKTDIDWTLTWSSFDFCILHAAD